MILSVEWTDYQEFKKFMSVLFRELEAFVKAFQKPK